VLAVLAVGAIRLVTVVGEMANGEPLLVAMLSG
jgi:hypothetical protein